MGTEVSVSILTADFTNIKRVISKLKTAGANLFHLDIMDGNFVPNISFGPKMVADIRRITSLPLDVHLMAKTPEKYIDKFAAAGSNIITIHSEATDNIKRDIEKIRLLNAFAGLSIKPATPVSDITEYLPMLDYVLVMSVEPGFGGQKFMPVALDKIEELKKIKEEKKYGFRIEVDGGITDETAPAAVSAGAQVLVSGNYVVGSKNMKAALKRLKGI